MPQFFPAPLLADIGEILGAIVTLGAIIFWVIQKIAEANKAMQKRPVRPAAPPQAPAAVQGGPRPAGQQADGLRSQVEEFLQRANQGNPPRQGGSPPRRPAPPVGEIELLVAEVPPQPTRQTISTPLPPVGAQRPGLPPFDRKKLPSQTPSRKRKTLAQETDERAAARAKSIAQKVSHLGARIIAEDRQFDDQLKAKFGHAVGTLAAATVAGNEPTPGAREVPAAQIAAMLTNPDGVRQAIVLNEVLRRPTDRW